MGSVVVVGSLNLDLHLAVPRHPRTGETVLAGDVERRFGGKGANQAVAAARAGAQCALVGKVGDDATGREYVGRLRRFGVDTSHIGLAVGVPTGTAVILVDDDRDNLIVVSPGANHRLSLPDLAVLTDLGPGDVLLLPLEVPLGVAVEAVRMAAQQGARVVVNLAPFVELPAETLARCDPVVVNEREAEQLRESGLVVPSLLVTLGAEGSRWGGLEVGAEPVTAIDTTGAGDAYCGTLAARLALGDEPGAAMAAAASAAARVVAHQGAQPEPDGPVAHGG